MQMEQFNIMIIQSSSTLFAGTLLLFVLLLSYRQYFNEKNRSSSSPNYGRDNNFKKYERCAFYSIVVILTSFILSIFFQILSHFQIFNYLEVLSTTFYIVALGVGFPVCLYFIYRLLIIKEQ